MTQMNTCSFWSRVRKYFLQIQRCCSFQHQIFPAGFGLVVPWVKSPPTWKHGWINYFYPTPPQFRHSSQNFVDSLWWLVVRHGTSNLCTSVQDTQTGSRSLISNLRNPTIVQNCKLTRHVFIALYGDIGWEKSISVSVFFIRLAYLICFIGCGDNVIYEGATKFMERKKNSAYTNTSWGH